MLGAVLFFGSVTPDDARSQMSTSTTDETSMVTATTSLIDHSRETLTYSQLDEAGDTVPNDNSNPVKSIPKKDIPEKVKCPFAQVSRDTGYVFTDVMQCTSEWAHGLPDEFMSGNSDGEAGWVMRKVNSKWKLIGICHTYYPMGPSWMGMCVSIPDQEMVDVSLLPPMAVQCAFWDASSWDQFIAETGCPAS